LPVLLLVFRVIAPLHKQKRRHQNLAMIRIYLVEDHQIVREGIKSLLQPNASFEVLGETATAENLVLELESKSPDLVITDITLPGMDGIALTRLLKKRQPSIRVLIVSMHADEKLITSSLEAGADGYLLKDFRNDELLIAIDKIMLGDKFLSRGASEVLTQNILQKASESGSAKVTISPREKQIIEFISLGLNNKEIAEKILLSTSTVDAHRYNILKKLEVKNTAEMITKAIKLKILILR
jgi:DNA-binding NarL/FixJ family response regulator